MVDRTRPSLAAAAHISAATYSEAARWLGAAAALWAREEGSPRRLEAEERRLWPALCRLGHVTCLLHVLTSYHPGGCAFGKHGACWTKASVQKDEL